MAPRLDFTSEAFFRDPPKAIAALRERGSVVATRFPLVGNVWITTTHDATAQVLKDGAIFTLRKEDGGVAGLRWWMPGLVRTIANNMLTMDEPDHTRLRSIVDEAFRRRAIVAMEPRIRAIAHGLADQLFAKGSPADLVQSYARILPLSVISELLGLPMTDRPRFIAWANAMSSLTNVVSFFRLLFAFRKMRFYLEQQLQMARERGGEGLIAELVQVEREGGQITPDEMVSMVFLLLAAGSETTTHLISGSVYELLRNPGLRDWLEEDWSRVGLAVEEFLRFVSPVQFSKPRYVRRDCRARRRAAEERRSRHGHARGGKHGPGGARPAGAARSRAQAEPPHLLRHGNSLLPRPPACTNRGGLRIGGAVPALAESSPVR